MDQEDNTTTACSSASLSTTSASVNVSTSSGASANSAANTPVEVDAEQLGRQEYETQYFGFTPKSFSDGIYNAMLQYHVDKFYAMQQFLKQEFPKQITDKQLQKGSQVMLPMVEKAMDRAFDKLESYLLTNILCIPDKVVLPSDQVHLQYPNAEEDAERLNTEIAELKKKIRNARVFNSYLKQQSSDLDSVLGQYNTLISTFKDIKKTCEKAKVPDLKESLSFLNQKAQKMAALLSEMTPKAQPQSKRSSAGKLPDDSSKKLKHSEMEPK